MRLRHSFNSSFLKIILFSLPRSLNLFWNAYAYKLATLRNICEKWTLYIWSPWNIDSSPYLWNIYYVTGTALEVVIARYVFGCFKEAENNCFKQERFFFFSHKSLRWKAVQGVRSALSARVIQGLRYFLWHCLPSFKVFLAL